MTNKEDGHTYPDPAIDILLGEIAFDAAGLVPAIAQSAATGEVLMLAWMNREAVRETLSTGRVTYWSRSRQALWRKGESSGHIQWLRSVSLDCDGDALLVAVDQVGPACHTNRPNCFFRRATVDGLTVISEPVVD